MGTTCSSAIRDDLAADKRQSNKRTDDITSRPLTHKNNDEKENSRTASSSSSRRRLCSKGAATNTSVAMPTIHSGLQLELLEGEAKQPPKKTSAPCLRRDSLGKSKLTHAKCDAKSEYTMPNAAFGIGWNMDGTPKMKPKRTNNHVVRPCRKSAVR